MDSDEDEQIGVKRSTKKTKGRKKSTTTATSTKSAKSNKKSSSSSTPTKGSRRIVKNQILDSDSDDEAIEQQQAIKRPKLELSSSTVDDQESLIFKKVNIDQLPTPSISSQLFTTTPRLNSVPLHENKPLNWSHKINLIGEKSLEQRVHLCDICIEPILYYGRLLPCKHCYCYDCAIDLQEEKGNCLRCNERIVRCERNALNTVYMCNHDKQCKRTYLSQRDLLAHTQHRHMKKEKSNSSSEKSLKIRTFNPTQLKDDYQPISSPYLQMKSNNGHHYPQQPSLQQTFRWVKNIQNYSEQTLKDSRKPK